MTADLPKLPDHLKELEGLLAFNRAMSSHERPSHDPKVRALIFALDLCRATADQAGKVEGYDWGMFPCYLIDRCEGEVVSEESIQQWVADMLKNPRYAKPTQPAATKNDGDWYTSDQESHIVDFDQDPANQLSILLKRDGTVSAVATRNGTESVAGYGLDEVADVIRDWAAPVSPSREVEAMSDDEIIEACAAAGVKWIEPDNVLPDGTIDLDGFPGSFDMATMDEMRALFRKFAPVQEKDNG